MTDAALGPGFPSVPILTPLPKVVLTSLITLSKLRLFANHVLEKEHRILHPGSFFNIGSGKQDGTFHLAFNNTAVIDETVGNPGIYHRFSRADNP